MGNKDNIQKWVDHYAFELYEESQGILGRIYESSPMKGICFWTDIEGFENVEFISPLGTKIKFSLDGKFTINDEEKQ